MIPAILRSFPPNRFLHVLSKNFLKLDLTVNLVATLYLKNASFIPSYIKNHSFVSKASQSLNLAAKTWLVFSALTSLKKVLYDDADRPLSQSLLDNVGPYALTVFSLLKRTFSIVFYLAAWKALIEVRSALNLSQILLQGGFLPSLSSALYSLALKTSALSLSFFYNDVPKALLELASRWLSTTGWKTVSVGIIGGLLSGVLFEILSGNTQSINSLVPYLPDSIFRAFPHWSHAVENHAMENDLPKSILKLLKTNHLMLRDCVEQCVQQNARRSLNAVANAMASGYEISKDYLDLLPRITALNFLAPDNMRCRNETLIRMLYYGHSYYLLNEDHGQYTFQQAINASIDPNVRNFLEHFEGFQGGIKGILRNNDLITAETADEIFAQADQNIEAMKENQKEILKPLLPHFEYQEDVAKLLPSYTYYQGLPEEDQAPPA